MLFFNYHKDTNVTFCYFFSIDRLKINPILIKYQDLARFSN